MGVLFLFVWRPSQNKCGEPKRKPWQKSPEMVGINHPQLVGLWHLHPLDEIPGILGPVTGPATE